MLPEGLHQRVSRVRREARFAQLALGRHTARFASDTVALVWKNHNVPIGHDHLLLIFRAHSERILPYQLTDAHQAQNIVENLLIQQLIRWEMGRRQIWAHIRLE